MKIEISNGEFLDKLSILEIKSQRLNNEKQLANVDKELRSLLLIADDLLKACNEHYRKLIEVNNELWTIEDKIREFERDEDFGQDFISTARLVYIKNDERALIKREINKITGSNFLEEKSYQPY